MAYADLTFKFWTDSGQTVEHSGTWQLTHYSDLSDGDQDDVLYLGSNTADRQLGAQSNYGVDDMVVTPVYILDSWEASTAYAEGDSIIPTTPNGYRYECSTAGTSDSSEPSPWATGGVGTTQSDGTVVWTLVADDRPTTEITIADSAANLDIATPGATLSLGTTIDSLAANQVEIHVRITNTISDISSTFNTPELGLSLNTIQEKSV